MHMHIVCHMQVLQSRVCSGSLVSLCSSDSKATCLLPPPVLHPEEQSMLVQDVAAAAGVPSGVRLQV
jgi:hypothetical protein